MCVEWLRQNPGAAPVPPPVEVPVKENRQPKVLAGRPGPAKVRAETEADAEPREPMPRGGSGPNVLLSHPELVSEAAIAELEALGYEVELSMTEGKSVFLVPAYTRTGRTELTFKDARTLLLVMQVLPGTRLVKIRSKSGPNAAVEGERS